jgi:hypothetical protein
MHEDDRDGAAVRVPPPLIYLGGVLPGVLVHAFLLPVHLTLAPGARVAVPAAAALLG